MEEQEGEERKVMGKVGRKRGKSSEDRIEERKEGRRIEGRGEVRMEWEEGEWRYGEEERGARGNVERGKGGRNGRREGKQE